MSKYAVSKQEKPNIHVRPQTECGRIAIDLFNTTDLHPDQWKAVKQMWYRNNSFNRKGHQPKLRMRHM